MAEEALAGGGDEEGAAEGAELGEVGDEGQVVGGELGESEAGVDDDALGGDAAVDDGLQAGAEFGDDLGDDVVVHGEAVHVLAEAAPVHDDEGDLGGGDGGDHRGVGEAAADVVDEDGAGFDGAGGDGGAHGVDGDGDAFGGEAADDGDDAAELFLLVDAAGAGAGGLAADVDEVGALGDEVEAVFDGGRGVEPAAAVGEGVGGHVDHAHDRAAVPLRQALGCAPVDRRPHVSSVGPRGEIRPRGPRARPGRG